MVVLVDLVLNGNRVIDEDGHSSRDAEHELTKDGEDRPANESDENFRPKEIFHPVISSIIAFRADAGFSRGILITPSPELSTRMIRPHWLMFEFLMASRTPLS